MNVDAGSEDIPVREANLAVAAAVGAAVGEASLPFTSNLMPKSARKTPSRLNNNPLVKTAAASAKKSAAAAKAVTRAAAAAKAVATGKEA